MTATGTRYPVSIDFALKANPTTNPPFGIPEINVATRGKSIQRLDDVRPGAGHVLEDGADLAADVQQGFRPLLMDEIHRPLVRMEKKVAVNGGRKKTADGARISE